MFIWNLGKPKRDRKRSARYTAKRKAKNRRRRARLH